MTLKLFHVKKADLMALIISVVLVTSWLEKEYFFSLEVSQWIAENTI